MSDTEAPENTLQLALRDWEENFEPDILWFEQTFWSSESPAADTDPDVELGKLLSLDRRRDCLRERWRSKWIMILQPKVCHMSLDAETADTFVCASGKEEEADAEGTSISSTAAASVDYSTDVYGLNCPTGCLRDIRIDKATALTDIVEHTQRSHFPNMVRGGLELDTRKVSFDLCQDSAEVRKHLVYLLDRMGFDGERVVSYVASVEGMHFWGSAVLWAYLAATEHPPSWIPNNVNIFGRCNIDVFTQWAALGKMLPVDDTYPKAMNTALEKTSVRPEQGQYALQYMHAVSDVGEVLGSSDMHLLLMHCDGSQTFVSPLASQCISKKRTTQSELQSVADPRELSRLMERCRIYEQRGFCARPSFIATSITWCYRFGMEELFDLEGLSLEHVFGTKKFQAIELGGYAKTYAYEVYNEEACVFYVYTKQQTLHKAAWGARAG